MNKSVDKIFLLLFFFSGAAGMIYELVWLRMFAPVFGVEVFALGVVLAVYMGGLGIGAYYWGRWIDRSSFSPLSLYGWLEVGIALSGLSVPFLLPKFDLLYQWFFQQLQPGFWPGIGFRLVTCLLVLSPPCFLMGGTLPALSRHLVTDSETAGGKVGWLYGINLSGAVLGTLLSGFYLIENWGVRETGYLATGLSLVIGLAALFLSRASLPDFNRDHSSSGFRSGTAPNIKRELLILIGLVGFVGMTYEIIWGRLLSLIMRNTVYAYSIMLVTFLTGLFSGDIIISRLIKRIKNPYLWLGICQGLVGLYLLFLIPYYYQLDRLSLVLRTGGTLFGGNWTGFMMGRFLLCGLVMFLPAVLMGTAFPLIISLAFKDRKELDTGARVGRLYLFDTMGMVLGSLIVPLAMIPLIGTQNSLFLGVGINLLVAVFCLLKPSNTTINHWAMIVFSVGYLIFGYLGRVDLTYREKAAFKGEENVFYREDYQGLVEVYRRKEDGVLKLVSNRQQQEGDSSLSSIYNQREQFYLPLLLHPRPRKILAVGLGTGISFGASGYIKGADATCLELSPAIAEAARLFRLPTPPYPVKVVVADGRNYLKRAGYKYDFIFADLFTPYRAGVGNLYCLDHYREVKKHLEKGGIFCQLLPAHQMPPACVKIVMNTFKAVFPEGVLFMTRWNLALIGFKDQAFTINFPKFLNHFQDETLLVDLNRYGLGDPYQFLSGYVAPLKELVSPETPINSDNYPLIEFLTPKYLFNRPDGPLYYENLEQWLPFRQTLAGRLKGAAPAQLAKTNDYWQLRETSWRAKLTNYQGNYLEALKLYQEVFSRNPSDPDAAEFLADYHQANADRLQAGGLFREAERARRKTRETLPWKQALESR